MKKSFIIGICLFFFLWGCGDDSDKSATTADSTAVVDSTAAQSDSTAAADSTQEDGSAWKEGDELVRRELVLIGETKVPTEPNPEIAMKYFRLAETYETYEKIDDAIFNYQRAIAWGPDFKEAYTALAEKYRQKTLYYEAVQSFQEALRRDEQYYPALLGLARMYIEMFDIPSAKTYFEQLQSLYPDSSAVAAGQGEIAFIEKNFEVAQRFYDTALRTEFDNAFYHRRMGDIEYVLGNYPRAKSEYQLSIEIDSLQSQTFHKLGLTEKKMFNYAAASAHFAKAIDLDPLYAEAYGNLGILDFEQGIYDLAQSNFSIALEIDPEMPEIHFNYGLLLYQMKNFSEAENEFDKALNGLYNNYEVHFHLGEALFAQKKYDKAEEAYQNALELRPDFYDALLKQGIARYILAKYEEALEVLNKAKELKKTDFLLFWYLARSENALENWDLALSYFDQAYYFDPNHQEMLREYGLLRLLLQQYNESEALLQAYLKFQPEDTEAQYSLALAQHALDRQEPALEHIDFAVEQAPDSLKYRELRGKIYYHLNRYILARTDLEKVEKDLGDTASSSLLTYLGYTYIRLEDYAKAETIGKQMMLMDDRDADAYAILGNAEFELARPKDGLLKMQRAVQYDPNNSYMQLQLADMYRAMNKKYLAVAAYEKALQLTPGYRQAYLDFAGFYAEYGEYDAAEKLFLDALNLFQEDPVPMFNLGVLKFRRGYVREALEWWDKALDAYPEEKLKNDIIQSMQFAQGVRVCPTCGRRMQDEWVTCPYDGTVLPEEPQ